MPSDQDGEMFTADGGFDGFYGEIDQEIVGGGDEDYDGTPSEEQRAAMLAHLDSILQVPPSLEIHDEGEDHDEQFEEEAEADGP